MKYRIANLNVIMNVKYEPLLSQSKAYITSDDAKVDCDLTITEEELQAFHKRYSTLNLGESEYMLFGSKFYSYLILRKGILLHSSAVVKDGYAYLFSAPSGTGKSTHTQLWLKRFKDAKILNDDKPAVIIQNDKVYACGTPFSGKTDLNLNEQYPIKAIIFLNRGLENTIEPMDSKEVIYNIMSQTIRPSEEVNMNCLLDIMDYIIKNVPIYGLYCDISLDAVDTVYNEINKVK